MKHTEKTELKVTDIIRKIAEGDSVDPLELIGESRTRNVIRARHLAMHKVRMDTTLSYTEIGKIFNRSHAAVIHACNKIKNQNQNHI